MENKTHKRTKKGETDGADKKKSKKRKEKKKEAEEGCGGEFGCGGGKWSGNTKICQGTGKSCDGFGLGGLSCPDLPRP